MKRREEEMAKIDVNLTYPYSDEYDYETRLERINLDKEREHDLMTGNAFVIDSPKGIKKDLKDPNGMFSSRYGQTLKDISPFANKYRCNCGFLKGRINNDSICPICGTKVKYVDDNFMYFGYKVLKDPNYIIHPNLYKSLENFIGKETLDNIIFKVDETDIDGHLVQRHKKYISKKGKGGRSSKIESPFTGIGILGFKERFDEIMEYYSRQYSSPNKKAMYASIMEDREKIFIQSIPYYTTLLRPYDADQKSFYYEDSNKYFMIMNKLASLLNEYNDSEMNKKRLTNDMLLYDLQIKYNELYKNIENVLQKKKGTVRSLLGGRYNFSSRCVIVPDPTLRIDEISLPYKCLVELLQQRIINIIQKAYNKSYSDAYAIWYKANIKEDPMVKNIIETLIKNDRNGKGLPCIINRNPTIAYGGILQMFCIKMTDTYTMGVPLQILKLLAARMLALHAGMQG